LAPVKAAFEDCFRQYSLTELPQDTELAARPFSIQVYIPGSNGNAAGNAARTSHFPGTSVLTPNL
jgi:hypothetical protein